MAAIHQYRGVRAVRDLGDEPYWSVFEMREMDAKFQRRMAKAIKAGNEFALIGVCTTPCTSRPVPVIPLASYYRSPACMAADLGEPARGGGW